MSLRRAGRRGRQVDERIWLVTFMHEGLGYYDDETCQLEAIASLRAESVTHGPEWPGDAQFRDGRVDALTGASMRIAQSGDVS